MSEDLKKDLEEFEGQISQEIYMKLLGDAYETIANLREALATTKNQEIILRDKIAARVYPTLLSQSTSSEQAAEDAYRAADKMLRVRETGVAFSSDLIKLLKELRDSSRDDTVFGRSVRTFLKDK
jgi:hypothetical protein